MKILWGRILITGLVLEVLYGLFLVFVLGAAEQAYRPIGLSSGFVVMAIGGFFVGRTATWRPVLQGGLVGVAAVLFYTALTTPGVIGGQLVVTGVFVLNHLLKILGATAGGWVAATLPAPKERSSELPPSS